MLFWGPEKPPDVAAEVSNAARDWLHIERAVRWESGPVEGVVDMTGKTDEADESARRRERDPGRDGEGAVGL